MNIHNVKATWNSDKTFNKRYRFSKINHECFLETNHWANNEIAGEETNDMDYRWYSTI